MNCGLNRYHCFGLREIWLKVFFESGLEALEVICGPMQYLGCVAWLRDAELIDGRKQKTRLCGLLSGVWGRRRRLVWQVIWVNLARNSRIVRLFLSRTDWDRSYSKAELVRLLSPRGYKERTVSNAVNALVNMLKESPLGEEFGYGIVSKRGVERRVRKAPEKEALLYCVYRCGELLGREFGVVELLRRDEEVYAETPSAVFGVSSDGVVSLLLGLQRRFGEKLLRCEGLGSRSRVILAPCSPYDVLEEVLK